MATNAYFLNQFISTTLYSAGGIDDNQTTGIILASSVNLDTSNPGIACLTYTDPLDITRAEWITYTSIDAGTNELQGVTRGQEGYSAKSHNNGTTIAFPLSESHINNLNTALMINNVATNLTEGVLSENNMVSNSATKLATQRSIRAYVNTQTTIASSATPTPTGDRKRNELYITELGEEATISAPTGTPANGNVLIIRIKDDGTARTLNYNEIYDGLFDTLPNTTTANKYLYIGFSYNSVANKWQMLAVQEQE